MRFPLALAALLLTPTIAIAQSLPGLYIAAGGGLNFAGSPVSAGGTTQLDTDTGGLGLAAFGWNFGFGLSTEIEGSYRSNGLSSIDTLRGNGSRLPLSNVQGSLKTWAAMVNVKYNLRLASLALPVQPYIGAGVGYAWINLGDASGNGFGTIVLPQQNRFTGPTTVSFGSSSAFAYQAIAGASLPLPFLPGLDATLEYRFFGTARADIPVNLVINTTNLVNGAIPSASTRNGFILSDNAVVFGVRYRF